MKFLIFALSFLFPCHGFSAVVGITMDDPKTIETPLFSSIQRDQEILRAFKLHGAQGALFVSGHGIDSPDGQKLLKRWDSAGHWIANHTYSHWNYHGKDLLPETFIEDAFRVEPLLSGLKNFRKLFRFPMLKEGDTLEKRDKMRAALQSRGYRQGYVTIDASDWYIDGRLIAKLKKNPSADVTPYRDFYLKHIWNRAQYYDDLAKKTFGREIKHTLLIHHNLLNALFLKDVLKMFKEKGWRLASVSDVFNDPVFDLEPKKLPAGEGIVWAAAKESGKFDSILRYPAEDGEYEKTEMDRLGL